MKKGDRVYLSDKSEADALELRNTKIFLANVGGRKPFACVRYGSEELFPLGNYGIEIWGYAIPIPGGRWMTREEVMLDNLDHPRRLVRLNMSNWDSIATYNFNASFKKYDYIDIPEGYEGDFSDLEIKQYKK